MEIIELKPVERPAPARLGLGDLMKVALDGWRQNMLEAASASSGGDAAWRARKRAEARDLLALAQIAPPRRLEVMWVEMSDHLRALLALGVPVPCRPDPLKGLLLAERAVLGLTYQKEAVQHTLPGAAFFEVLEPCNVWHANVGQLGSVATQRLCLGATLPAGMKCTDLIVMAYGALSMQTAQIDEGDPAGVINVEAARWWQQNMHRVPLSKTPFLRPDAPTNARQH